jgi:hypothetical protein
MLPFRSHLVRVRRLLLGIVAALTAAGCTAHAAEPSGPGGGLLISPSPTAFQLVTAGQVHGAVPDGWYAFPADPVDGMRGGFVASPRAGGWPDIDGTSVGMAATYVDATRVGVPSDYYYLAANGPLLSRITTSGNCRDRATEVYLDRRPTFDPTRPSPGHFMAEGEGICRRGSQLTRYAYFVAAPGYGPVHELGIPASGLYVVVAVVPQQDGAHSLLRELFRQTRFGDDGIRDFLAIARTSRTKA